jgi:hypothetical protein
MSMTTRLTGCFWLRLTHFPMVVPRTRQCILAQSVALQSPPRSLPSNQVRSLDLPTLSSCIARITMSLSKPLIRVSIITRSVSQNRLQCSSDICLHGNSCHSWCAMAAGEPQYQSSVSGSGSSAEGGAPTKVSYLSVPAAQDYRAQAPHDQEKGRSLESRSERPGPSSIRLTDSNTTGRPTTETTYAPQITDANNDWRTWTRLP